MKIYTLNIFYNIIIFQYIISIQILLIKKIFKQINDQNNSQTFLLKDLNQEI